MSESVKSIIDAYITSNGNQEITGNRLNYVLKEMVSASEAEAAKVADRVEENEVLINDLQNSKIDKEADDYYPQLSVGVADNLAGVDEVESDFSFRRSGAGAITDGVARVLGIKGNSVVWNQVYSMSFKTGVVNGITITRLEDNSIKCQGTATATYANFGQFSSNTGGHKYLFVLSGANGSLNGKVFSLLNRQARVTIQNGFACIFHTNADPSMSRYIGYDGMTVGEVIDDNVFVTQYDLTKMFGAGNEPNTIEEFYQRIPMGVDINAYNEGEVIDMKVQGVKSVGRNAWDEEWELGNINTTTGANQNSNLFIRSKNLIKVLPNTQYYIRTPNGRWIAFLEYDKNYQFLRNRGGIYGNVTTSADCAFVRFYVADAYGTTYNHDICINISDSEFNGQYDPYQEETEDLSLVAKYFPNGMRSAGTACDEIRYNKASNRWEKKEIRQARLKDLNWKYSTSIPAFYAIIDDMKSPVSDKERLTGILSNRFALSSVATTEGMEDKSMLRFPNSYLYVKDNAYTSVGDFIASLNDDDFLYYEPIDTVWEEIEEKGFNLDYKVWNCGTETAIAEGKSSALSAGITYGFNAVGLIKQLRTLVAALQAKLANL